MKSFKHSEESQIEILRKISTNNRIKYREIIEKNSDFLGKAYGDYARNRGNAWNINGYVKDPELVEAMSSLFKSSAGDLAYINNMRKENKGKCCAMCGALRSGQIDHFLPQKYYPEFSIFLPNLFPICGCNQIKQHKTIGSAIGERFLHPSYDRHLSRRAVSVLIRDHDSAPTYKVIFEKPRGVRDAKAFDFHTKTVIDQEELKSHVKDGFERLCRRPSNVIRYLGRLNPRNKNELSELFKEASAEESWQHRSNNNWDSVLFQALAERHTLTWIWKRMSAPGRAVDDPLLSSG